MQFLSYKLQVDLHPTFYNMSLIQQYLSDENIRKFEILIRAINTGEASNRLHMFVGSGGNGKTTLLKLIESVYNDKVLQMQLNDDNRFIGDSKLVVFSEPDDDTGHSDLLKKLVHREQLRIDDGEIMTVYKPEAEVLIISNNPNVFSNNPALRQRLNIIDFDRQFNGVHKFSDKDILSFKEYCQSII